MVKVNTIVGSSQFGLANLKILDVETFPQRQAAGPVDESPFAALLAPAAW